MPCNNKPDCCNQDCNQGRNCPLRNEKTQEKLPFVYKIRNLVYNLPFQLTLIELAVVVAVALYIIL